MKKTALIFLSCALFVLTGCYGAPGLSREIDDLELILIMGVDYAEEEYEITLAGGQSSSGYTEQGGSKTGGGESSGSSGNSGGSSGDSSGGAESGGKGGSGNSSGSGGENSGGNQSGGSASSGSSSAAPPVLLSARGKTISAAVAKMQAYTEKHMFYGHLEQVIIGQSAAEHGVEDLLDYMRRDPEMRPSTKIYVTRDCTARDIMEKGGGHSALPNLLAALEDAGRQLSLAPAVPLGRFEGDMVSFGAVSVPALKLTEIDGKSAGALEICGSAVFRENKLAGYLSQDETRGANILSRVARTDMVELDTPEGQAVALRITETDLTLRPVGGEDEIECININVYVEAEVAGANGGTDVTDERVLEALEIALADKERERVADALTLSEIYDADFARIYPRLRIKAPRKLPEKGESWQDFLHSNTININVEAVIRRVYNTKNPGGTR
ncbi:MAG: hypothetical protein IJP23_06130 [Oscillospiraceae bacterium]|nr:hypothetical protein [Oscillospiraceae bacterium]